MFHWNETARFDRIVKKRQTRWHVVWYCSSSSFFHLKAAQVATFSKHLMLHLSTKPYTNMMVWHLTIPWYGSFWSIDTATASAAPPPINRDEFHVMGKKKFEAKVWGWGGDHSPCFHLLLPLPAFSHFLRHRCSHQPHVGLPSSAN